MVQQVKRCPRLAKVGMPEEAEEDTLALLSSTHQALQIVPSPAAGHLVPESYSHLGF